MAQRARPADTSPEVWRIMRERERAMTPVERALLVDELTTAVTDLALAGIRSLYPDASDVEVAHELARRRHGGALADAVHGRRSPRQ